MNIEKTGSSSSEEKEKRHINENIIAEAQKGIEDNKIIDLEIKREEIKKSAENWIINQENITKEKNIDNEKILGNSLMFSGVVTSATMAALAKLAEVGDTMMHGAARANELYQSLGYSPSDIMTISAVLGGAALASGAILRAKAKFSEYLMKK